MELNITNMTKGDDIETIINHIRDNKTLNDKVRNQILTPFMEFSIEISNGKKPNAIKIGILNAYYNGIGELLGLRNN